MRKYAKAVLTVVSLAGSAVAATSVPATAAPPPAAATVPAAPATAPLQVTLVTGDRVLVGAPVAGHPTVTVFPAPRPDGHSVSFSSRTDGDDVYVIPSDVARLVPRVLDAELFDVTALVRNGYDDATRSSTPLIVQNAPGVHALSAPAGLRLGPALPSIGGEAATLAKGQRVAFGQALTRLGARRQAITPSAAGDALGGVSKVWLDGPVTASGDPAELDGNLRKIGAPAAWQSGLSGTGVKVAVLDTGVDAGHPDLTGQVAEQANFTTDADNGDDNGHGTHVASLVAGTGAGANGARRGVAYGAQLLAGKVLDGDGQGQTSWVIAGMQWAVEHGADVVNMSLGGHASWPSTDDPLVDALDSLTASSDALFVVAAGNTGSSHSTVQSPGVAPSALTVGAVDFIDDVTQFSSRGPTPGDFRLKPEVTAPGVEILGARAGARSGDLYTSYTGTSQATPQVAGAAALLRQQHPDWSWDRVKDALTETADLRLGAAVWDQGGGRIDLARATTEPIYASQPTVDFGLVHWDDLGVRTREVTLNNPGDSAVTVGLSNDVQADGGGFHPDADDDPPPNPVTMSANQLSLPAHGSASFTISIDPTLAEVDKLYGGTITVSRGDTAALHVPVLFQVESEHYPVTVKVLDRDGRPYAGGLVDLVSAHDTNAESVFDIGLGQQGTAIARVVPGWYSIQSEVHTPAADGTESISFVGNPEVHITGDTSITLDARDALPVHAPTVPRVATTVDQAQIWYGRYDETHRGGYTTYWFPTGEDIAAGRIQVQPTKPVQHGIFALTTRWRLLPSGHRHHPADLYDLVFETPTAAAPVTYHLTDADVRRLARIDDNYDAPGGWSGTAPEVRASWTDNVNIAVGAYRPVKLPSHRVELVTAAPYVHWQQSINYPVGSLQAYFGDVNSYRPGQQVTETWFRAMHPVPVDVPRHMFEQWMVTGLGDGQHVGRYDLGIKSAWLQMSRDGTPIGERDGTFGYFNTEPGTATFAAEQKIELEPDGLPGPPSSHTTWTFTSSSPTDPAHHPDVTPPVVVLNYTPVVDDYGYARAHLPLLLDIQVDHVWGATAPSGTSHDVTLSYSADNGRAWHKVHLARLPGNHYLAVIPGSAMRADTPLSIHATATDAGGNAIDQTVLGIIRAR